ncbi:uncharacterized protein [Oryza sativa Japonica Group]|uniref:uncharacterized protein n=1 Tax=Oryza sativa subsp. japonica TaxID=39947 RepID=UPI00339BC6C2
MFEAGGGSYIHACQEVARITIGELRESYNDQLADTEYRYHPRQPQGNDRGSYLEPAGIENDATTRHLVEMLWAMDETRVEIVLAAQDREDRNRGKICKLEDKVDRVVSLKKEFRVLTQGSRFVTKYLDEFNRLPRYTPEDVCTDEERQEKFLEGLNDELSYPLMTGDYHDFQKLVDKAIRQEDKYNRMEKKKHRIAHFKAQQGNSQRPRLAMGPQAVSQGGSSSVVRPQRQLFNNNASNNNRSQAPRPVATPTQHQPAKREQGNKPGVCFNCGEPGHYSDKCPKPRRVKIVPAQNNSSAPASKAHVNHVAAAEAQSAPDVILEAKPTLIDQVREAQINDPDIQEIKKNMRRGKAIGYLEDEQGTVWLGERICVPENKELKDAILKEAHDTLYSIYPGSTKMYQDLKEKFWWASMKYEV